MPKPTKLYADSEGVERGYYVYLHRSQATDEVFYVGKGHGRRAWETTSRHSKWQEKVASLSKGWYVEIANEDLSEIEAFETEKELVEQHGGPVSSGGKLTNWMPGGEFPASIEIAFQCDDGWWAEAYYKARQFKESSRKEQEAFVQELDAELKDVWEQLQLLQDEAIDDGNQSLEESVDNLLDWVAGYYEVSSDFLRRRVSWKDFAMSLEDSLDSLESDVEDIEECHPKVKSLLEKAAKVASIFMARIDSGNRAAAVASADQSKENEG